MAGTAESPRVDEPSDPDGRVSASEMLAGLEVFPLEPGVQVAEALLVLKVRMPDGDLQWSFRKTSGMSDEELLGMLVIMRRLVESNILEDWE